MDQEFQNMSQGPQGSQAPQTPAPPVFPGTPSGSGGSSVGNFLDQKTKDTALWSAIGYGIRSIIVAIIGAIAFRMLVPAYVNVYGISVALGNTGVNVGAIINTIIWGVIMGAIAGIILAKFYLQIQKINQNVFGGWFNTLFKLLFYPSVVASVLSIFLAGGFGSVFGGRYFVYLIFSIAAELLGSYVYAKLMVKQVGQYYQ